MALVQPSLSLSLSVYVCVRVCVKIDVCHAHRFGKSSVSFWVVKRRNTQNSGISSTLTPFL